MNFWKRWIGSIQKKTGHLSLAEIGAYDRLLDHYYATEQPLPGTLADCCRIARAMSAEERKAVGRVLREFFQLEDGLYTQGRADAELSDAQPKIAAAHTNGAKGGRPRKNPYKTQEKPTGLLKGNPEGTQGETSTETETENTNTPQTPKPFDKFWTTWPASKRKGAKGVCEALWDKIDGDEIADEIIAHVESQKPDWQRNDGEYIPAPRSYLNQRRWEGAETAEPSGVLAGAI